MRRRKFIGTIFVAVLFVLLGILLAYATWQHSISHSLDFQTYTPNKLPNGVTVKSRELSIYHGEGSTFKRLVYTTSFASFSIWEVKSSPEDYRLRDLDCNAAPMSTFIQCKTWRTPKGQTYNDQVELSSTSSKERRQTISWLRGKTLIWISLNDDQVNKYPPDVWDSIINDFTPIQYVHEPIKQDYWQGV